MARRRRQARELIGDSQRLRFDQKLVLSRWMLSLFEVDSFLKLADGLTGPELEGLAEDNVSRFHLELKARLFDRAELPGDVLGGYDQNIVRHTLALGQARGEPIRWKYFQYLGLLFTEVYLDRYFRDAGKLLADLNAFLDGWNGQAAEADRLPPFEADDLRKLAFWSATGSGKTLLMHVHIAQYRHYLELHGRSREVNRIILLSVTASA